jgi:hypothetical protein
VDRTRGEKRKPLLDIKIVNFIKKTHQFLLIKRSEQLNRPFFNIAIPAAYNNVTCEEKVSLFVTKAAGFLFFQKLTLNPAGKALEAIFNFFIA